MAVKLPNHIARLDIGNPKTLWKALEISYHLSSETNILHRESRFNAEP
jgi:hypothetical protein